jgi:hypothetical protein
MPSVAGRLGDCRDQNQERATFHHIIMFWKPMVKVNRQAGERNVEKAWTHAKRLNCNHPKGEFKQEGSLFFPKCNDVHVHWHAMIVCFNQKTIFLVDSCGDVNHEKDAAVMLTFFWLAFLKKRAVTRHSSRRDVFMV